MRKSTVARWFGTVLTAGLMAATVPALTSTVPPAGAYPFPYWPQSPYSGWYRIVNQNSGRCLDARGGNSADGTAVQQYVCNGTASQDFELVPTSDGYFKIVVRLAPNPALSVAYGSLVNQAPVELRGYANGADQQWQVDRQSDGYYHFVARHSSRCLDVPGGSTANALQLQQYTCNGTVSQSRAPTRSTPTPGTPWSTGAAGSASTPGAATPATAPSSSSTPATAPGPRASSSPPPATATTASPSTSSPTRCST
jgi:hypothetical protein